MKIDVRDQLKPSDWNNFIDVLLTRMVYNEIPVGVINGVNVVFTLAFVPFLGKINFFHNGQLLIPGATFDYQVTGPVITMNWAPAQGLVAASYIKL